MAGSMKKQPQQSSPFDNPLTLPLIMLAASAQQAPPTQPATPITTPGGGAKPSMFSTFAGAAAAPTQRQLGGKTLLGQ